MWPLRRTVSKLFASVGPTVWTRAVVCTTVRMQRMQTYCAFNDALVLLNVVVAPRAEVMINLWARPPLATSSIVPGMRPAATIVAMPCDNSWYLTVAKGAVD